MQYVRSMRGLFERIIASTSKIHFPKSSLLSFRDSLKRLFEQLGIDLRNFLPRPDPIRKSDGQLAAEMLAKIFQSLNDFPLSFFVSPLVLLIPSRKSARLEPAQNQLH